MDKFFRYSRQIAYKKIGSAGQEMISAARAAIIGMGALGTAIANNLARSGMGYLRLIDKDHVELSNLQRQSLYNEDDAAGKIPKVLAAFGHLSKINSQIHIEPVTVHVDSSNIEDLIKDVDVVLDGSDNVELRFLVNEACHKQKIPWVQGGVLGAGGSCMTILPGEGPCFRCVIPNSPPAGSFPTGATSGVIGMAPGIIAAMESAEAIKIITRQADINRRLFVFDLWNNTAEYLDLAKNPGCPVCGHSRYEMPGL